MNFILKYFSNREIATAFWLFFVLFLMLIYKNTRQGIINLIKAASNRHIISVFMSFIFYIIIVTIVLYYFNLWKLLFIKDSIIWFLSVGLVLCYRAIKFTNTKDFIAAIKELFKWTILVEFVCNFFTFSLWAELLILPTVTIIAILKIYAEFSVKQNEEHKQVLVVLTNMLTYIGYCLGVFIIYKTITGYHNLINISVIQAIALPVIYSASMIPFIYMLALYVQYEMLFVRVPFLVRDEERQFKLRKSIAVNAKLNLNHLVSISKNIAKMDLYNCNNFDSVIGAIAKK